MALFTSIVFVLLFTIGKVMAEDDMNSDNSKVHVITVGKSFDAFVPDNIKANVGDIITFKFYPANHSVVRSEYHQPCIPYEYTGENKEGFFSGFYPVEKVLSNPPSWNLTVNDTAPIFYYCSAPGSCQNHTMVGVINANNSVSLPLHQADARQSKLSLSPGEPFPAEGEVPAGDKAVGTGASNMSSSANNTASAPSSSSGDSGLSGGAMAGIVIAALFLVALLAGLFFLLGKQRSMLQFLMTKNRSKDEQDDSRPPPHIKDGVPEMARPGPHPMPNYHYYGMSHHDPKYDYLPGNVAFGQAPPQYPQSQQPTAPTSPLLRNPSSATFVNGVIVGGGGGGPWELPSREGEVWEEKDSREYYGGGGETRRSWHEAQRSLSQATRHEDHPALRNHSQAHSRQDSHPSFPLPPTRDGGRGAGGEGGAPPPTFDSPNVSDIVPSRSPSPKSTPQLPHVWPTRKASSKTA